MPRARGDLVPMSRVHLATFNNFKNLLASEHLPVLAPCGPDSLRAFAEPAHMG